MCYTKIEAAKPRNKKFYWKVVKSSVENYYSFYVDLLLQKNRWIEAKNNSMGSHIYMVDFKGFGVFTSKKIARRFLRCRFGCNPDLETKIVKVLCCGNGRKAQAEISIPCYIFDKIKIID